MSTSQDYPNSTPAPATTTTGEGQRRGPSLRDISQQELNTATQYMIDEHGYAAYGAVAKLGGEPRRPSFSFPDGRCVPAFSGRLEDPVDDHRVRIGVPISKHRALTFP